MRRWMLGASLLAVAVPAHADPPAATTTPPAATTMPPPPAPAPERESAVALHAGLGFGRYTETATGLVFECDIQPTLQVSGEAGISAGRGRLILQATATLGLQVGMHASQGGMTTQQNDFRQEVVEISPRFRAPISPSLDVDLGYRFTLQRLHFIGVPMIGDALETVMVHAAEAGLIWHRTGFDGRSWRVEGSFGLNRGSPDNNLIEGENFSATGHSFRIAVERRYRSGLALSGIVATRTEDGDGPETVTFMGMQTQALWPNNTTWTMMGVASYLW